MQQWSCQVTQQGAALKKRMEKFKVEKAEQIRLNAARTAPSETGNKELAHKVKKEFDKEK